MVIYKTTNLVDGKWYIGKDSRNYKKYLGSGIHLKHAIEKHGAENFVKEILQECSDMEELNDAEKYWIEKTNAVNDPSSYNLANGGQGGDLSKFMYFSKRRGRPIHSEEEKKKRSDRWKGNNNPSKNYIMTEEHKEKLRVHNKTRVYNVTDEQREHLRKINLGKKASDETREKMRQVRTGKKKPGVLVYAIKNDVVIGKYESIQNASNELGITYKQAYGLLLGRTYETISIKLIRKENINGSF